MVQWVVHAGRIEGVGVQVSGGEAERGQRTGYLGAGGKVFSELQQRNKGWWEVATAGTTGAMAVKVLHNYATL